MSITPPDDEGPSPGRPARRRTRRPRRCAGRSNAAGSAARSAALNARTATMRRCRAATSARPEEVLERRTASINWRVLLVSSAVIVAFSVWAILVPGDARMRMKTAVDWIAANLGWYYVLTMTLVIGFVLWVAFSRRRRAPRPRSFAAAIPAVDLGRDAVCRRRRDRHAFLLGHRAGRAVPAFAVRRGRHGGSHAGRGRLDDVPLRGGGLVHVCLAGHGDGILRLPLGHALSIRAALYPLLGKRVRGPWATASASSRWSARCSAWRPRWASAWCCSTSVSR